MSKLKNQKTWILIKLSFERKVLKDRWIYKIKTNSYDVIQRYKVRYVVKEYLQKFEIDYIDTFTNIVRSDIYRILFYLTVKKDWKIH